MAERKSNPVPASTKEKQSTEDAIIDLMDSLPRDTPSQVRDHLNAAHRLLTGRDYFPPTK